MYYEFNWIWLIGHSNSRNSGKSNIKQLTFSNKIYIWLVTYTVTFQLWKPNGVNVNSWSCDCVLVVVWYKLKPKQLTAAGVAQLETSMHQREFCELTACPRAEQIPCICIELTGDKPCLNVVCLWYVSGIVSLSLHLSSWMGIFGLVLVMVFHNLDQYLMQKHLFRICSWKW